MNALWLPWNTIYLPLYEAAKRRIYHWQLDRLRAAGSIHPGVSQARVRAGGGGGGVAARGAPYAGQTPVAAGERAGSRRIALTQRSGGIILRQLRHHRHCALACCRLRSCQKPCPLPPPLWLQGPGGMRIISDPPMLQVWVQGGRAGGWVGLVSSSRPPAFFA